MELLCCVVNGHRMVEAILTGFLDIGIHGATVVDAKGMGEIITTQIPIFAGFKSMFPVGGGHTYLLLEHLKGSCVFAIDCDQKSIDQAKKNLLKFSSRVSFFKINFLELFEKLPLEGESISGILIDPGISTFQLKHGSRGFSHSIDEKLDMRKDQTVELNAFDVVNSFR